MFSFETARTLAGAGYITLNAIRVLNIISLLMVAVASWIMLVMTVKTSSVCYSSAYRVSFSANIAIVLLLRRSFTLHNEQHQSLFNSIRAQHLPQLLLSLLASSQPRIWLCLSWISHDCPWFQYSRKFE